MMLIPIIVNPLCILNSYSAEMTKPHNKFVLSFVLTIEIEVSRSAIAFTKAFIIRLPQFTDTTLNFASRIAHLLTAYYSNNIFKSLVKPTTQRAKSRGLPGESPGILVVGGGNTRGNLGCK